MNQYDYEQGELMKRSVYRITRTGNLNNLRLLDEDIASPSDNEILIQVKAIGLNFADIFAMYGLYSATPGSNFIPGLEFAGIVLECGPAATGFSPGDEVMGITRFGGYSSHLLIDPEHLVHLPQGWNLSEGAGYLVQVLTAYYALFELGNLQPDQTVLIHSAAGGVGLLANRFAKKSNAFTLGSIGSATKRDLLVQEGYDRIIVRDRDFATRLKEALAGRPLHLVLECIGGRIFRQSYDALAPQGRLVVYGSAHYASPGARPNYPRLVWKYLSRPRLDPMEMVELNKSVMGFNLIWLYHQTDYIRNLLSKMSLIDIGKPLIGHRFPFSQLPQAVRLFQSGKTTGKVVVEVE